MFINIVAAILVFSIIVIVHELGHFLLAKKNGITVVEFSVGMGPRLLSFTKNGTKYSIKALPFGGSCMMLGEDEDEADEGAFNNKSVWARVSVIAAGPIFNFILAFVFAVIIISNVGYDKPVLTDVIDGYPAQEAGLMAGDVITKLNNETITIYRDVSMYLYLHPGENLKVQFTRGGERYETTIAPKLNEETGNYMMGIQVSSQRQKPSGVLEIFRYSAYEVKYLIKLTVKSVGMVFQGKVKADDLSGPVGIVTMIGESVEESKPSGFFYVFLTLANMCILLSANLGVMNLLPFPALDGGRLVFLLIEAVLGRPIDREKEGLIHVIGMVCLMALMVFILFNDIRKLF